MKFICLFVGLVIEPRSSCMQGKHSITYISYIPRAHSLRTILSSRYSTVPLSFRPLGFVLIVICHMRSGVHFSLVMSCEYSEMVWILDGHGSTHL